MNGARHMLGAGRWRSIAAPAALCALIAGLGALPYVMFVRDWGSLGVFTSAFDESSYQIFDITSPYRYFSAAVVGLFELLTPSAGSFLLLSDLVVPVAVALAAWAVAARSVKGTGLRLLGALLLLFGQELFSLANTIVWPVVGISNLRDLSPLATKLIPDAMTTYFSLFRTPEPQVSWMVLLAFLALIAGPDPLSAFEGKRRWLTFPLFALLTTVYPFISAPILALTGVLLIWALVRARDRVIGVAIALALTLICFLLLIPVAGSGSTEGATSLVFASRLPTITPALVGGLLVAAGLVAVYRADVLRRSELLVALAAALTPLVLVNQQVLTGAMVSTRDWERNANYVLLAFSLLCVAGLLERHVSERLARGAPNPFRLLGWVGAAGLTIALIGWQVKVYDVWMPSNVEANQTAALLEDLPSAQAADPVVVESAGIVPQVRVITGDSFDFVLDYTRLFDDPLPTFADDEPDSPLLEASKRRLFEYYFRLGSTPEEVDAALRDELTSPILAGFYSEFAFAMEDISPPLSDARDVHRDEALRELPNVIDEYRQFARRHEADGLPPAVLVTIDPPADPGDGRVNELLASADPDSPTAPSSYLQSFPAAGG